MSNKKAIRTSLCISFLSVGMCFASQESTHPMPVTITNTTAIPFILYYTAPGQWAHSPAASLRPQATASVELYHPSGNDNKKGIMFAVFRKNLSVKYTDDVGPRQAYEYYPSADVFDKYTSLSLTLTGGFDHYIYGLTIAETNKTETFDLLSLTKE